jgi:hypothetical protein
MTVVLLSYPSKATEYGTVDTIKIVSANPATRRIEKIGVANTATMTSISNSTNIQQESSRMELPEGELFTEFMPYDGFE